MAKKSFEEALIDCHKQGYVPNIEYDPEKECWYSAVIPPCKKDWGNGYGKFPFFAFRKAFAEARKIQSKYGPLSSTKTG